MQEYNNNDCKLYFPLKITTPHVEVITKTTFFQGKFVVNIVTVRSRVVRIVNDQFYNYSRQHFGKIIDDLLLQAGIQHSLEIDLYRESHPGSKTFFKDKHFLLKRLTFGHQMVARVLCEDQYSAVCAPVVLHTKRKMIGNSLEMIVPCTLSLSLDIVRAVFVNVSIESLAGSRNKHAVFTFSQRKIFIGDRAVLPMGIGCPTSSVSTGIGVSVCYVVECVVFIRSREYFIIFFFLIILALFLVFVFCSLF